MKRVFFVRELMQPVHVKPGEIRMVDAETYYNLRALKGGAEAMLNLTPKPLAGWFDMLAGRRPMNDAPAARTRIVPCPNCWMIDRKTRQMRLIRQMTHCELCDGENMIVHV